MGLGAIFVVFVGSFMALVATVLRGGWLFYPLAGTLAAFFCLHWGRGHRPAQLLRLMVAGARRGWGVLSILLLIGALMAAWMAAGTVSTLVYYGLELISPQLFVLSAFGLTAAVSVLIGTSFGAVGTMGLALMIMARAAGGSEVWTAGAIIAGAYVGDRCSPMSSSAHLVATLTHTDIYANLKAMVLTSRWALGLSLGVYGLVSWFYPLTAADDHLQRQILQSFGVQPWALGPAIAILLLVALRVPVKRTMAVSLGLALGLAALRGYGPLALLQCLLTGFALPESDPLAAIFRGGGLVAMGRVCAVVLVSMALAGLLGGTGTFQKLEQRLGKLPPEHLGSTAAISLAAAAYGCTQTAAIALTHELVRRRYLRPQQLAVDLENTAVVLSPLVPWNIAGLVPATILAVGPGFIPCAVYLYLLPLLGLGRNFVQDSPRLPEQS